MVRQSLLKKLGSSIVRLSGKVFQVDESLFEAHKAKFAPDRLYELESNLKEDFLTKSQRHQHNNYTLFNILNVILEQS